MTEPTTDCPRALAYWANQAALYAPPHAHGLVRFTARHQHAAVLKLLSPRGGELVLDAGCGSGLLSRALVNRGARVWAVDFAPEMVKQVKDVERAICADLETLKLDTLFDAVTCVGALNFVDAGRVLERLAAHLRPGGVLVVAFTRVSIAGALYTLSRKINKVPFRLWTERQIVTLASERGLTLTARETMLPHDVTLAFTRQ